MNEFERCHIYFNRPGELILADSLQHFSIIIDLIDDYHHEQKISNLAWKSIAFKIVCKICNIAKLN